MQIINSPWRKRFEAFVASARKELRIAVPYYSEDIIRIILERSKGTDRYFLLKLSDGEVRDGVQSPRAVRLLQEHACTVKFIKNLHAKIFIADRNQAVVTSSNLTNSGLSENAEVGVLIDEPKAVQAVLSTFEKWYDKAGSIGDAELSRLESLPKKLCSQTCGKSYGNFVQDGTASSRVLSHSTDKRGWILIHSQKKYGEYGSPQEEIEKEWKGKVARKRWYWVLPRPMKERTGPFRLLLSWQGVIFGEFLASKVTRKIKTDTKEGYNFAFVLDAYYPRRKVPLNKVHVPKHHRSMIKLDKRILTAYEKAASIDKNS
ncbi:MAG: phospholipase D-like domain-containing protein [Candidatus Acidiferrales bacterium]